MEFSMRLLCLFGIILLNDCKPEELTCLSSYHKCGENDLFKCIPADWVCDYNQDCEDGSDEANCPLVKCQTNEFKCRNFDKCVPKLKQCDGIKDCLDNSDETDCDIKQHVCDRMTQYNCNNEAHSECIPLNHVCKNISNCSNKKDLNEDCNIDMCLNSHCSHGCVNKYSSFECYCPAGMKLEKDNLTCKNVDFCLETPEICEQDCTSTNEGPVCSCYDGFKMVGKHCSLNNTADTASMLYLNFDGIYAISLPTKVPMTSPKTNKLVSISDKLVTFDVNLNGKNLEVFSSLMYNGSILSLNTINEWKSEKRTAKERKINFKSFTLKSSFYSIATDTVRNLVFWTDTEFFKISVVNVTNLDKFDIISKDCYYPISLVVDPILENIFWIDLGNGIIGPRILTATMDGSNVTVLIKLDLRKPTSLALDFENQRLYWNDLFPGSIKYLNLKSNTDNKNKINTVLETYDFFPFSIALYKNRVYWSDGHQNRIYSVHKISGKNIMTVAEQVRSSSILIVSSFMNLNLKKKGNDPKSASSCTGVRNPCTSSCLPTSNGLAKCFGSSHENFNTNKDHSSFWWFLVVPVMLLFGVIVIFKYHNYNSKNVKNIAINSKNVWVNDDVKFCEDDNEQSTNDSQIINVSDTVSILETV